jgi:hypothetical protein
MKLDIQIRKIFAAIILLVTLFFVNRLNAQEISLEAGSTISTSSNSTLVLGGGASFINNSENQKIDGTIVFQGEFDFSIAGLQKTIFDALVLDLGAMVHLNSDVNVESLVSLDRGIINLADRILHLRENARIEGEFSENAMIVATGEGRLALDLNGIGEYFFPVGDIDGQYDYSPAKFTFTEGKFDNARLFVNVKNNQHPAIRATNNYLKRYWTVEQTGISNFLCKVDFTYVRDDIYGNAENMYGAKFAENSWKPLNKVILNEITGYVRDFADFSGGKFSESPNVNGLEEYVGVFVSNNSIILTSVSDYKLNRAEIVNMLGQTIYTKDLNKSNYTKLELNNHKGIHILRIYGETGQMSKKIVLQ